ncbi:hypothetical protein BDV96DRAFT_654134 [Lophiotrema nucula]|uniref:Uncharacterized protein n=1 Tax=Lophiotrema nucula TaxID=690887 RepID=A0A6A5YJ94_9PLEO|nr:hypothetical protein BDV96DRAFT_654134 [Lophiotrema nucula]
MATNEATTETRQKAMDEATTDKLDDISPPLSPETEVQDAPEHRADIGAGGWQAPPSPWNMNDNVFLRLRDGRSAGPFWIVRLHAPKNRRDKWRYDVQDATGRVKTDVSVSIIV